MNCCIRFRESGIMEKALNYIDIFAGCGGLSTGLFNAGWHGLFAVEKNADAFSTLKFNLIDTVPHFVWPEWLSMEAHDINELINIGVQGVQTR